MVKKIISSATVIAILISAMIVPVRAFDGLVGAGQSFFEWVIKASDVTSDAFWRLIYGDDWMSADTPDLEAAYDTYVSDLQTDLGSTTLANGGVRKYFTPESSFFQTSRFEDTGSEFGADYVLVRGIGTHDDDTALSGDYVKIRFMASLVVPFSASVYTGFEVVGNHYSAAANNPDKLYSGQVVSAGNSIYISTENSYMSTNYVCNVYPRYAIATYVLVRGYADFIPIDGFGSVGVNVDQSTRVGSLVGDFVSDNDSTVYKDVQLVDEANGTYYNPVTGNYNTITNWSYDYSDRSYTVTTDSNNTYTITYGDEYVTINEADTIYNLYYTVPDSGSGGSGDSGGGSGDSGGEKETIWDKLGNLLGTIGTGILDMVEAVLGKLLDGLNSLAEMIGGKLKALVEMILDWFSEIPALFSGFLGFLSGLFSFLPSEVVMLLEFGLAAVIFIAIFKAIFRR